jgi:hypothetical protein
MTGITDLGEELLISKTTMLAIQRFPPVPRALLGHSGGDEISVQILRDLLV